jgi:hypothetical protein
MISQAKCLIDLIIIFVLRIMNEYISNKTQGMLMHAFKYIDPFVNQEVIPILKTLLHQTKEGRHTCMGSLRHKGM